MMKTLKMISGSARSGKMAEVIEEMSTMEVGSNIVVYSEDHIGYVLVFRGKERMINELNIWELPIDTTKYLEDVLVSGEIKGKSIDMVVIDGMPVSDSIFELMEDSSIKSIVYTKQMNRSWR